MTRLLVALAWVAGLAVPCQALANISGRRWTDVPSYVVFQHGTINGVAGSFSTDVLPKVVAAHRHWTANEVSCTSYDVVFAGTYAVPSVASSKKYDDGANRIYWQGAGWPHTSDTLAMTTSSYDTGTGHVFDSDMAFNNNKRWSVSGASNAFDVETVAVHEAGHFLGLDHSNDDPNSVMYFRIPLGSVNRQLTQRDITEVCTVYPGAGGDVGTPCASNADCRSGLGCRGAPNGGALMCTQDCGGGGACPQGLTCQQARTSGGGAAQSCLLAVGSPDLCHFCVSDSDCSAGICLTTGPENFCSITCANDTQCGAGYVCYANVCVPPEATCPSPQCASDSGCPTGYRCQGGMCRSPGEDGDRCEISLYCKDCLLCVGSASESTCRPCCAGSGQGGSCDACTNTACGAGASCLHFGDGAGGYTADAICVPPGAPACQGCATDSDCSSDLICVNGLCHAPCNAGAANGCEQQACGLAPGEPQSVCACTHEIALAGQACGMVGGTLRLCAYGTQCVGTPATCRAPCGPGLGCRTGESCEQVDGQSVCLPTHMEGQACGACVSGGCGLGLTCQNNRCYQQCDVTQPVCSSCVATNGTAGICGCADEQSLEGGPCGLIGSVPYTCANNALCHESSCRLPCSDGACGEGFACTATEQGQLCVPLGTGCGCSSGMVDAAAVPLVAALWWLRRRRRTA